MAVEQLGIEFVASGFASLDNALDSLTLSINQLTGAVDKSADEQSAFGNSLDSTEKKGSGLSNFIQHSLSVAFGNILSSAVNAATTALANFATASVGTLTDSIKLSADFESAMTTLSIAAKSTGISLSTLHDASLAIGADSTLIGVSASGAADAMTGLFKAGLTGTEVFGDLNGYLAGTAELGGALRASIDLAAASELDIVQSSELAAIALSTFGSELKTDEERAAFARDALDNFVKSADASVANVTDLADALKNVGPTAASFGFSLEETNAALAVLSTRGISGAEAGTALKSMMTNLMRPTDAVKGALSELGVNLFDNQGKMKSLSEIVGMFSEKLYGQYKATVVVGGRTKEQQDELDRLTKRYASIQRSISDYTAGITGAGASEKTRAKHLADLRAQLENTQSAMSELSGIQGTATTVTRQLTEEQRLQYIQTLAGTEGMKAFSTLAGEGVDGWKKMTDAIAGATGTQEQAALKSKELNSKIEALQGVIETLRISAFDPFLSTAKKIVDWMIDVADKHGPSVIAFFGDMASRVSGAFDAISNMNPASIFSDLQKYISGIASDILKAFPTETLSSAQFLVYALVGSFKTLLEFLSKINLGKIFADLQNVKIENILPPVFIKSLEKFGDFLGKELFPFLLDKLALLVNWFAQNSPLIIGALTNIAKIVVTVLMAAFVVMERTITALWPIIEPVFNAIFKAILGLATFVLQILNGDWQSAWNGIVGVVSSAMTAIMTPIGDFFTNIGILLDTWWSGELKRLGEWQDDIGKWWDGVVSGASKSIDEFTGAVSKWMTDLYTTISTGITQAFDWLRARFEEVRLTISAWLTNVYDTWNRTWISIATAVSNSVTTFISSMVEGLTSLYNTIVEKVGEIQEYWDTAWGALSTTINTLWSGMVTTVGTELGNIYTAISTKMAEIVSKVQTESAKITGAVVGAIESIGTWITNNWDTITGYGSSIVSGILSAFSAWTTNNPFINSVSSGLSALSTWIANNYQKFAAIGAALMNSLLSALQDNASAVINYLSDMIKGLIEEWLAWFGVGGGGGGDFAESPGKRRPPKNPGFVDVYSQPSQVPAQTIYNTITNNYNLTTNAMTREGGLRLEFDAMRMASR